MKKLIVEKPVILKVAASPQEDIESNTLATYFLKHAKTVQEAKSELKRKNIIEVYDVILTNQGLIGEESVAAYKACQSIDRLANSRVMENLMMLFSSVAYNKAYQQGYQQCKAEMEAKIAILTGDQST